MNHPDAATRTMLDYRKRVCEAMNFISRNLDRDLSLDEVAAAGSFSKSHFHRIFKALVGETVAGFTRRLRLEHAANLLLAETGDDVTTIAMNCGFSSSQNFAKAFRQHFATSPSAYRKSKCGNKESNGGNDASLLAGYSPDTLVIHTTGDGRSIEMKAEVKEMPAYHVAYVRKIGPYGKETCEQAFSELGAWAGPRGYFGPGTVLGVYWDNPEVTPPEKCRSDACVTVPEGTEPDGQVGIQTLRGGPCGVCHFELTPDGFQHAWDEAFAWLVGSGYECDDSPCFEVYHNDAAQHPEGKWIVDVCIPLKA